jgi:hypothetical protein
MTLESLRDERDVCDALYRFAEGIDLRDWALYRTAFTDALTFDYTSYRVGSAGTVSADDWVARARRRFETLAATSHAMTNPRVSLHGDRAVCAMYVEASHSAAVEGEMVHCILGGRYVNDLVRVGAQWRIEVLRLEVRWIRGDRSILDR